MEKETARREISETRLRTGSLSHRPSINLNFFVLISRFREERVQYSLEVPPGIQIAIAYTNFSNCLNVDRKLVTENLVFKVSCRVHGFNNWLVGSFTLDSC